MQPCIGLLADQRHADVLHRGEVQPIEEVNRATARGVAHPELAGELGAPLHVALHLALRAFTSSCSIAHTVFGAARQ
jgi:hypothetical protein